VTLLANWLLNKSKSNKIKKKRNLLREQWKIDYECQKKGDRLKRKEIRVT
jgi:hypothetical protein